MIKSAIGRLGICLGSEDKLKEECGVFGVFSREDINIGKIIYHGLYALQHRGQESAGIAFSDGNTIKCHKSIGLVSEVFSKENLINTFGQIGIGHVRYSTTGDSNKDNAQPILQEFNSRKVAIAHNGNLLNTDEIKEQLSRLGINFKTTTDSEVILKLIGENLNRETDVNTIINGLRPLKGAYSFVLLTEDSLIGVRDPDGIRPLCIGKLDEAYVICSESCALTSLGGKFIRDVEPGEMVIINKDGIKEIKFSSNRDYATCAFEYIYFAREDSVIDGVGVYKSRVLFGEKLYEECPVSADIVIGVPDSGIPSAIGYAKASGIPYAIGLIRNKYLGRSFIQPSKEVRENVVSLKLTLLGEEVEGKRVVIVDDSIVRGTTTRRIAECLRQSGAKEIHFRIASPPIKHCCFLGINTSNKDELIASYKSLEDIREHIGVDSLRYISINGFLECMENRKLCLGCLNGKYPYCEDTEKIRNLYLNF